MSTKRIAVVSLVTLQAPPGAEPADRRQHLGLESPAPLEAGLLAAE